MISVTANCVSTCSTSDDDSKLSKGDYHEHKREQAQIHEIQKHYATNRSIT
eukprot:m.357956 g.357956  ORF g.357956 m.357956 type:complete len:51 (+) comp17993_c0_seq1:732-884(+)